MRRQIVWTIFRKELLESLRDRRTLIMMVALPAVLYPLLIMGVAKLQESQMEASEARVSRVAIWGGLPGPLLERLGRQDNLNLEPWGGVTGEIRRDLEAGRLSPPEPPKRGEPAAAPGPESPAMAAARSVVLSRQFDAIVVAWPGLAAALDTGALGHVSVFYDSVRPDSAKARGRLADEISDYRKGLVEQRERERGLAGGFSTALQLHPQDVATRQRLTGRALGMLLPMMLIVMSAMGGFYCAIDVTAGEKERATIQTLLCAPLRSTEIIAGKFLAVSLLSLMASLANVVSMAATFARLTVVGSGIQVGLGAYGLAFVLLIPVSLTLSALFLAVATFAKDFKDGQNYLTPLLVGLMLPPVAAMTPGVELNAWTAFVPVVNIVLLMKAVFLREAGPDLIFLTLLSSAAYAALAVLLAARVFERENLLLGGRETLGSLVALRRRPGGAPTPGLAVFSYAVVLVAAFYGSLLLARTGALAALLSLELGFFLAPNLLLLAAMGFSFSNTLSLRWPSWRALAGSVLLGLSAWTVAGGALVRLLPPPESVVRALEKIMLLDGRPFPLWVLWLVIAVTPAVCEELFFRGLILSGLRSLGQWPALLITALLFGLAHSSIYRLLPVFFLGLVFSYAVWKSGSILCGVVAHALNNGLMVTVARSGPLGEALGLKDLVFLPWSWVVAGAVALALGLWLLATDY